MNKEQKQALPIQSQEFSSALENGGDMISMPIQSQEFSSALENGGDMISINFDTQDIAEKTEYTFNDSDGMITVLQSIIKDKGPFKVNFPTLESGKNYLDFVTKFHDSKLFIHLLIRQGSSQNSEQQINDISETLNKLRVFLYNCLITSFPEKPELREFENFYVNYVNKLDDILQESAAVVLWECTMDHPSAPDEQELFDKIVDVLKDCDLMGYVSKPNSQSLDGQSLDSQSLDI